MAMNAVIYEYNRLKIRVYQCTAYLVLRVLVTAESDGIAGRCWTIGRVTPSYHHARITHYSDLHKYRRHSELGNSECTRLFLFMKKKKTAREFATDRQL